VSYKYNCRYSYKREAEGDFGKMRSRSLDYSSVEEHLPSMHEALGLMRSRE
jgi:hypothetical protein